MVSAEGSDAKPASKGAGVDKTLMKKLAKKEAKEKVKWMKRRKAMQAERDGNNTEDPSAEETASAAPESATEPMPAQSWKEKGSAQEEAVAYLQVN